MLQRLKNLLRSEKAEANYISAVVFLLIGVIFSTFLLNVFSLVSTQIQMDNAVNQLTKQMQMIGGQNSQTTDMFLSYSRKWDTLKNVSLTVSGTRHTPKPSSMDSAFQLGTPFTVTLKGRATLGGFWNVLPVQIYMSATARGVSEVYWK